MDIEDPADTFSFILIDNDMTYLYLYDGEETKQSQTMEKDYIVKLNPNIDPSTYYTFEVQFDGEQIDLEALQKGLELDRLPEKVQVLYQMK